MSNVNICYQYIPSAYCEILFICPYLVRYVIVKVVGRHKAPGCPYNCILSVPFNLHVPANMFQVYLFSCYISMSLVYRRLNFRGRPQTPFSNIPYQLEVGVTYSSILQSSQLFHILCNFVLASKFLLSSSFLNFFR